MNRFSIIRRAGCPSPGIIQVDREKYVSVRVVNINDVDLTRFTFDYDLTLAFVLAHPDGTVYHRYGGRTSVSPMNMDHLVHMMREGLASHADYLEAPHPPEAQAPLLVRELVNERVQGQMKPAPGCIHCHYVREAWNYLKLEAGKWTPNQFWAWPLPDRIGLVMHQKNQHIVASVIPESAADRAGIRAGDVLKSLEGRKMMSKYDIQAVLEGAEDDAGFLAFQVLRDENLVEGLLHLESAWKTGDPADYAWRFRNVFTKHMLKFLPTPGFIGDRLSDGDLTAMGLPDRSFGLRISNLNYGTFLAGIREGDIVLGAGGKSNFQNAQEFHRWCELLRRAGRDIRLQLYREQRVMNVMVSLAYLNYSKVEAAPRVELGFIPQELPREGGLRVGHVTDGSPAEQAGLRIGDRIVSVDGLRLQTFPALQDLLNRNSPGRLLTLNVRRESQDLQVGFVLAGETATKSSLAHLSAMPIEPGQIVRCVVNIDLPDDKHIYSVHRPSMGLPTELEFHGTGYELIGPVTEPEPRKYETEGSESSWVLDGKVELEQKIRITSPARFKMVLHVYAQVCDDKSCHEFRAVVVRETGESSFVDFAGDLDEHPVVIRK